MATQERSSAARLLGLVLAIVLVAGIAATPLYLGRLQTDERALDSAIDEHVEVLRRTLLAIDPQLGALADMDAGLDEQEKLDSQTTEQLQSSHPEILGEALVRSLGQTAQLLKDAEARDGKRGTHSASSGTGAAGSASLSASVAQMRKDYLTLNTRLIKQAQGAIDTLRQMRQGALAAGVLPAVNRVQAMFYLAVGKLHAHKAGYEQQQAAVALDAARQSLDDHAVLQRYVETLQAQQAPLARRTLEGQTQQLDALLSGLDSQARSVGKVVGSMEADLAATETAASEARQAIDELTIAGPPASPAQADKYLELSAVAREAEAAAAALMAGLPTPGRSANGDDTGSPDRERPPGLRELRSRQRQVEDALASLTHARSRLREQLDVLAKREEQLESQLRQASEASDASVSRLRGHLDRANQHVEAAGMATDEALNALKLADGFAQNGIRAVDKQTKAATALARRPGKTPDERLDLISKDADTEVSMLCLAAEIASEAATLSVRQLDALQTKDRVEAVVSRATGENLAPAPAELLDSLKNQAAAQISTAIKTFETAEKLLSAASFKSSAGTIAGSNYVWQTQIGQAAAYLLRAALGACAESGPDREAEDKAYELLSKAVQGREQSPLLAPALNTLVYLQQVAQ
jgi:hypothetical protein